MINGKTANLIGGALFLLFAIVFFWEARNYSYQGAFGPGPGFFPAWLSGLLIVLAAILIVQQFFGRRREKNAETPKGNGKKIAFVLIAMVLYTYFLPLLGFVLASVLFLAVLFSRGLKWHVNIIVSIGLSVSLFLIFDTLLGVALPTNRWGW